MKKILLIFSLLACIFSVNANASSPIFQSDDSKIRYEHTVGFNPSSFHNTRFVCSRTHLGRPMGFLMKEYIQQNNTKVYKTTFDDGAVIWLQYAVRDQGTAYYRPIGLEGKVYFGLFRGEMIFELKTKPFDNYNGDYGPETL